MSLKTVFIEILRNELRFRLTTLVSNKNVKIMEVHYGEINNQNPDRGR